MFASLNGLPVESARVMMPLSGVWQATVTLDGDDDVEGRADLSLGGVLFRGFIRRSSADGGQRVIHVAGGAGGMGRAMDPRGYRSVPVSIPLQDIMGVAGETLAPNSSKTVLATPLGFWTIMAGTCGDALSRLFGRVGAAWRMLPDGTLWVGSEGWPTVAFDHEVITDEPLREAMVILADAPLLSPGQVFRGRRTSYVEHDLQQDHFHSRVHFA